METQQEKKLILFVDDEPNVLSGLRRMLRPFRNDWEMDFVASGQEALDRMAQKSYDVIVSDVRMPKMDGCELFTQVSEKHPKTIRIALSGETGEDAGLRLLELAHQRLSKPCDPEHLRTTVSRACALHGLLSDPQLEALISQMGRLPSLPTLYAELMAELRSPNTNFERVTQIIAKDVAMSAKILQLVNSSFMGLRSKVTSLTQSITLLGLKTIRSLALSVQAFSQFDDRKMKHFSLDAMMNHSVATATYARKVAEMENHRDMADEAFMAGLLHDTGKLVFIERLPEVFDKAIVLSHAKGKPLTEIEHELIGTTHAEVGAYLLGLWGVQDTTLETLAYHHRPGDCLNTSFSPLTAVHIADMIESCPPGMPLSEMLTEGSLGYIEAMGLAHRIPAWEALAEETTSRAKAG
jgi:HD-like signal output (HDOD) protein/ActR/RegA family two-component response regulator